MMQIKQKLYSHWANWKIIIEHFIVFTELYPSNSRINAEYMPFIFTITIPWNIIVLYNDIHFRLLLLSFIDKFMLINVEEDGIHRVSNYLITQNYQIWFGHIKKPLGISPSVPSTKQTVNNEKFNRKKKNWEK